MDTILKLKRRWLTNKSTVGEVFYDNSTSVEFYSLEDRVRDLKIPAVTAIPEGNYEIVVSYSNRFKRLLPLLVDVPNFEGVRIHSGNRPEDTEGCILLGMAKGVDAVGYALQLHTADQATFEEAGQDVGESFLTFTSGQRRIKMDDLEKYYTKADANDRIEKLEARVKELEDDVQQIKERLGDQV